MKKEINAPLGGADKQNKKTAVLLILLATFVYAVSYIGRKSYDANFNEIMNYYGQGKDSVGLAGTAFFIAYGAGQVIHGLLCGKYNPKYSVLAATLAGGACNLLVGFLPAAGFGIIKYVWFINGFMQAILWSSTVMLFDKTLAAKYKGLALFIMGFPVSVGTFAAYGMSALFSFLNRFKLIFFVAGGLMLVIAAVWFFAYDGLTARCIAAKTLYDGESVAADGSAEKTDVENGSGAKKAVRKRMPAWFIWLFAVMCLIAVVNNFVKDGLTTWAPTFLKERYGLENWFSVLLTLILPLFALFGSTLALALNKKIGDFVLLSGVLYLAAAVVFGVFLACFNLNSFFVAVICFAAVSCLMSGVNNVVTAIFPMKSKSGVNAGFVAGIADGFCYLGSAFSSYGFGLIAENFDWNAVMRVIFFSLAAATLICAAVFLIRRLKKPQNSEKSEKTEE